jgi:hypothetical protein
VALNKMDYIALLKADQVSLNQRLIECLCKMRRPGAADGRCVEPETFDGDDDEICHLVGSTRRWGGRTHRASGKWRIAHSRTTHTQSRFHDNVP